MKRIIFTISAALSPLAANADDWQTFSAFWGYVLTIEEQCADYAVLTDAMMGNHLHATEYELAQDHALENRDKFAPRVGEIGCDAAAAEAASMMNMSMRTVWGIG